VEPTLFGDKEVIKQVCQENGIDINAFNIVNEPQRCEMRPAGRRIGRFGQRRRSDESLVSTDKYMRGILNEGGRD